MTTQSVLSKKEAAARLGVSLSTLRRYVSAGVIKPVKYTEGAHPRFRVEDVERLIGGEDPS